MKGIKKCYGLLLALSIMFGLWLSVFSGGNVNAWKSPRTFDADHLSSSNPLCQSNSVIGDDDSNCYDYNYLKLTFTNFDLTINSSSAALFDDSPITFYCDFSINGSGSYGRRFLQLYLPSLSNSGTYYYLFNNGSSDIELSTCYLFMWDNSFVNSYLPSDWSIQADLVDSLPDSGVQPSGTIEITENGTFDVSSYATADVNVPTSSGGGGSTDVSGIIQAIYVLAGTMLVIYFFFCIYRMIMGARR